MKSRKARFLIIFICLSLMLGCNNRRFSSGDRVLVSRFSYDAGVGDPERFQVVVFKYPQEPVENGIPKNYIKRLMGLPGQIIAIFFGNIFFFDGGASVFGPIYEVETKSDERYVGFLGEETKDEIVLLDLNTNEPIMRNNGPLRIQRADVAKFAKVDEKDLWQRPYMLQNNQKSFELFNTPGKFKMLRKPPEVMLSMRRIVYDNDYPAKDLIQLKFPPRWDPAKTGWVDDDAHGFGHTGETGDAIDWLRYQHIVRPWHGPAVPGKKELINDFMDYNGGNVNGPYYGQNWVSDLMLETQLKILEPRGEFWMELSRGIYRFQARFDLSNGKCTLFQLVEKNKKLEKIELDTKPTSVSSPGSYDLRFANFDSRLTIWVNGELPFGNGYDYHPPELPTAEDKNVTAQLLQKRSGPTLNDLEPASVGAKNAPVQIRHLRLWRDTYYTVDHDASDAGFRHTPDIWSEPDRWADLRNLNKKTLYVHPGHYLCLGDNSPQSSDSREWGTVPHRLLLGRALVVYFPPNRMGAIR